MSVTQLTGGGLTCFERLDDSANALHTKIISEEDEVNGIAIHTCHSEGI